MAKRRIGSRKAAIAGGALIVVAASAAAIGVAAASTSGTPALTAVKVTSYGTVVGNAREHSVYLLSKNGKPVACTGGCTSIWPPVLVAKGTKVTKQSGVKGTVTLKARGSKEQVVLNGWPLYTYAADTGAKQSHGEGIKSYGGTWWLAHASATTHGSTAVTKKASSGGGGGGGW